MAPKSKSSTEKLLEEILANYKSVLVYLTSGTVIDGKAISLDIQTHSYYVITDNMVVIIPDRNIDRVEVIYQ